MIDYHASQHLHANLPDTDIRLLFGAAPTGDLFQSKIDEIFKNLLDVFGIVDDILVVR